MVVAGIVVVVGIGGVVVVVVAAVVMVGMLGIELMVVAVAMVALEMGVYLVRGKGVCLAPGTDVGLLGTGVCLALGTAVYLPLAPASWSNAETVRRLCLGRGRRWEFGP